MNATREMKLMTRREWLRNTTVLAGSAVFVHAFPRAASALAQAGAAQADPIAAMRAQLGAAPIETVKLAGNLAMLSGPGGNIVVLNGPDGKIVVDSFVQTAWPGLKQTLDGMGGAPLKLLIDTHWHFDHVDNNANFRQAGAGVLAHENTKKRMSETHELLGMRFTPAPQAALPTETFKDTRKMQANGENIDLTYVPPAHTDTDIYIYYTKANVLHLGDVFFNGAYPFIDAGTGGSIGGTIAGADRALRMADTSTKIVPGHGPLGDKAALARYRDVLVTVRDRVQKLKSSGRKLDEVLAAKPTADLDAAWGNGFMRPNDFLTIVYNTL